MDELKTLVKENPMSFELRIGFADLLESQGDIESANEQRQLAHFIVASPKQKVEKLKQISTEGTKEEIRKRFIPFYNCINKNARKLWSIFSNAVARDTGESGVFINWNNILKVEAFTGHLQYVSFAMLRFAATNRYHFANAIGDAVAVKQYCLDEHMKFLSSPVADEEFSRVFVSDTVKGIAAEYSTGCYFQRLPFSVMRLIVYSHTCAECFCLEWEHLGYETSLSYNTSKWLPIVCFNGG